MKLAATTTAAVLATSVLTAWISNFLSLRALGCVLVMALFALMAVAGNWGER